MMSERENLQTLQQMYEAFGRGDIPALLNALTDDVDWHWTGPADFPYAGPHRGREQVARFFSVIDQTLEVQQFEPQEFIAQGDTVVVLGHERSRVRSTGRTFEQDWAMVYTLREGKVVRFRTYEDTAAQLAAFRGA
jgi:ketosteroid isomerase-like protein